ncbi:hypothetical protein MAR_006505 [Mya arenaria]|uniref:Uncharacterized protein n=1 Tax=Mya arenaria TaxID=6604 RepID=A0ABY7D8N9_MYAAR|nr:hypothetical protein MAR_006505 [Mya arenaria]
MIPPNKNPLLNMGMWKIRMKELLKLAIIRADIMRRIGITDPPQRPTSAPLHESTESPQRSHGIPFKPLGITRILSESPDTRADTNIIQFKLSNIPSDNRTVVDIVRLLVRVKYKKKIKQETLETLSTESSNEGNKDSVTKKSKQGRCRKQISQIELTVSNVTVDGQQGSVIMSRKN